MKEYLGQDYNEDNYILNWLRYWAKNDGKHNDEWRKVNDLDCIYLHDDLCADTIISIFQILQRVINSINQNVKVARNIKDIEMIIRNFDQLLPKKDPLVQQLQILASKAELRSNFMHLPNRKMQIRGLAYADEMSPTLYQCFDDGIFSKYFKEITVKQWVEKEKLKMLFKDNIIDRDHIKPTINGYSSKQCFKRTRERELILGLIEYSITFLDKRAQHYK